MPFSESTENVSNWFNGLIFILFPIPKKFEIGLLEILLTLLSDSLNFISFLSAFKSNEFFLIFLSLISSCFLSSFINLSLFFWLEMSILFILIFLSWFLESMMLLISALISWTFEIGFFSFDLSLLISFFSFCEIRFLYILSLWFLIISSFLFSFLSFFDFLGISRCFWLFDLVRNCSSELSSWRSIKSIIFLLILRHLQQQSQLNLFFELLSSSQSNSFENFNNIYLL